MKAKTVRLLAGGLAAVTLMSNMAVMPVFADEAHTVDAVATEAVADDSYDAEAAETVQESENDEPQVSTETEEETESQDAETKQMTMTPKKLRMRQPKQTLQMRKHPRMSPGSRQWRIRQTKMLLKRQTMRQLPLMQQRRAWKQSLHRIQNPKRMLI